MFIIVNVATPLNGGMIATSNSSVSYNTSPGTISSSSAASNGLCGSYFYQWEKKDDVNGYVNIIGATSATYTVGNLKKRTNFRRKAVCGAEWAYSNEISILVTDELIVGFVTPDNSLLPTGVADVTLTANPARGGSSSTYSYAWQSSTDGISFTAISGATNLQLYVTSPTGTKYYRVQVTCNSDISYSNTARIVVGVVATDLSYVRVRDILKPGVTDTATARALSAMTDVRETTQYFDGLGRTAQTVIKKGSSASKDMVTFNLFDGYGRQLANYLPFAAVTNDGNYKPDAVVQQSTFQQLQNPDEKYYYSQSDPENGAMGRVMNTWAPGMNWVGSNRGVGQQYWFNTIDDSVRIWNVSDVSNNFGTYTTPGKYLPGDLYKTITADEHKKQVIEFKDKEGKVILKKVQINDNVFDNGAGSEHLSWLCTYYIYDKLGNLRAVIQPEGTNYLRYFYWTSNSTLLDEQYFRYEYDTRNRMIMKKVPGAAAVNMIYNARDQLVLSQDGNQLAAHKWMYTTYDELNRPVVTGLLNDPSHYNDAAYHRNAALGLTNYPNFSNYSDEELTRTFYDDYSWLSSFGNPATPSWQTAYNDHLITPTGNYPYAEAMVQAASVKGMVTGIRKKLLGTASTFLFEVTHYNDKMRVMQTMTYHSSGSLTYQTSQYGFLGKLLRQLSWCDLTLNGVRHDFQRANYQYDDLGRLNYKSIEQYSNISNTWYASGERWTAKLEYDAMGQLNKKTLSPFTGTGLENQEFDYNIRGWMLGMNRDYAKDGNDNNYFGFDLGYDKTNNGLIGNQNYAAAQYNGNITGMVWKSKGDGEKRKYDFSYDAANRILSADFNQYSSGSFNKTALLDFSMSGMGYDLNGNITAMKQRGWSLNQSKTIDSLYYNYLPYSNRLNYVTDGVNDTASKLGDFKELVKDNNNDYSYDANGNMIRDNNKGISSITYNHLNLPAVIQLNGKGTIYYGYDATGQKQSKIVVDSTGYIHSNSNPIKRDTTYYIGNGVYQNRQFQFISFDEGRIRFNETAHTFAFDYFLKDHLGNTRAVITDETKTDAYPAATMETANNAVEDAIYTNISNTRVTRPSGFTEGNTYASPNDKVAKVKGGVQLIGPGITLKVMAGDKFSVRVNSYYSLGGGRVGTADNIFQPIRSMLNNTVGGAVSGNKVTAAELNANNVFNGPVQAFLDNRPTPNSSRPKAYLNYILFDERFQYIQSGSGLWQVGADGVATILQGTDIPINKNGYLYIFTSNETTNVDVYFDDLQVTHTRGPLLEETHYYPFGLTMAGISSKALGFGDPNNKYKYNGKEEQRKEFSTGTGLDVQDFGFRQNDYQLGRFTQKDPMANNNPSSSPYSLANNNPIKFIDFMGLSPLESSKISTTYVDVNGRVLDVVNDGKTDIIQLNNISFETWNPANNKKLPTLGGKLIGRTLYWYDFMDTNELNGKLGKPLYGSNINNKLTFSMAQLQKVFQNRKFSSSTTFASASDLIDALNSDWETTLDNYFFYISALYKLSKLSGLGDSYDIKSTLLNAREGYMYTPGFFGALPVYTTGKAIGNILFGENLESVSDMAWSTKGNVWETAMSAVGAYNTNSKPGAKIEDRRYWGEHPYSGSFIFLGFWNFNSSSY